MQKQLKELKYLDREFLTSPKGLSEQRKKVVKAHFIINGKNEFPHLVDEYLALFAAITKLEKTLAKGGVGASLRWQMDDDQWAIFTRADLNDAYKLFNMALRSMKKFYKGSRKRTPQADGVSRGLQTVMTPVYFGNEGNALLAFMKGAGFGSLQNINNGYALKGTCINLFHLYVMQKDRKDADDGRLVVSDNLMNSTFGALPAQWVPFDQNFDKRVPGQPWKMAVTKIPAVQYSQDNNGEPAPNTYQAITNLHNGRILKDGNRGDFDSRKFRSITFQVMLSINTYTAKQLNELQPEGYLPQTFDAEQVYGFLTDDNFINSLNADYATVKTEKTNVRARTPVVKKERKKPVRTGPSAKDKKAADVAQRKRAQENYNKLMKV